MVCLFGHESRSHPNEQIDGWVLLNVNVKTHWWFVNVFIMCRRDLAIALSLEVKCEMDRKNDADRIDGILWTTGQVL